MIKTRTLQNISLNVSVWWSYFFILIGCFSLVSSIMRLRFMERRTIFRLNMYQYTCYVSVYTLSHIFFFLNICFHFSLAALWLKSNGVTVSTHSCCSLLPTWQTVYRRVIYGGAQGTYSSKGSTQGWSYESLTCQKKKKKKWWNGFPSLSQIQKRITTQLFADNWDLPVLSPSWKTT